MMKKQQQTISTQSVTYTVEQILSKEKNIIYLANDGTNRFVIHKISHIDLSKYNEYIIVKEFQNDPNFVNLITTFQNEQEDSISLVFEFIPDTLKSKNKLYSQELKKYFYQLLESIRKLHNLGFNHGYLIPENCVLKQDQLKLTDFSRSNRIGDNTKFIIYRNSAPEILVGNHRILEQSDIWAMGCIMAEILLGDPLFYGADSLDIFISIVKVLGTPKKADLIAMEALRSNVQLIFFPKVPLVTVFNKCKCNFKLLDLLSRILIYDPKERITIDQALKHPYFESLFDMEQN